MRREISSTSLFALGYGWRRCPRRRRAAGRQLRMPVVALVRGYTWTSARAHTRGDQRLSSSRAVVGHRTRGRSKINGRGAIATGRATVLEDLEDRRRPRLADRVTAHALCLRCIPQPPRRQNRPRTHVRVRRKTRPTNATNLYAIFRLREPKQLIEGCLRRDVILFDSEIILSL